MSRLSRLGIVLGVLCLLPLVAVAQDHRGSELAEPTQGDGDLPLDATALGVALNEAADCTNADLDITLTTVGATREAGITSLTDGTVLFEFEQGTGLANFDGTFFGYGQPVEPDQPAGTIIGSYAYVGETPPSPDDTAEFFILYVCDTQEVLLSCFGPYGGCPQTADEAMVPAVPTAGLVLLAILVGLLGIWVMRRTATQWRSA